MAKARQTNKKQKQISKLANKIARKLDADVVVLNYGIDPGFEYQFFRFMSKRKSRRKNLVLFLTTEGGNADAAYRIGRWIQDAYNNVTIVVAGWCKSAGTLLCTAADQLVIADTGELGPLDVQIAKADEIWERSSGLVVEAAFQKLQQESFGLFFRYLMDMKEAARRITFRTAAEIAAQMAVGQTKEIFGKIDPISVGEDYRSNLIAEHYALRLSLKANNLIRTQALDGLEILLRGYPSHRFAVDRREASQLFKRVTSPKGDLADLTETLGRDVVEPRSQLRDEPLWLEYLNDEAHSPTQAQKPAAKAKGRKRPRPKAGARSANVRGLIPVRSRTEGGSDQQAA